MKLLLSVVLAVIFLAGNIALAAERENPLEVFAQLKRATKVLSGASDLLASGQREVLLAEESYVKSSLDDETNLLNQLTGSDVQRNGPDCVEFIRTSANLLMSLTGIAYTNCLTQVDDQLFDKLSQATALARDQYDDQLNLLGLFRGENIFVDPAKIRQKLANWQQTRTTQLELSPETTATLGTTFDELKDSFRSCLATAQARLADNLNFASQQVRAICAKQV